MTTEPKKVGAKVSLLALAEQLRNVTAACKRMGFSRGSFYRFRRLYETGGEASLEVASRRKPIPSNRVDPDIEAAILRLAFEEPTWGQARVADELKHMGMIVSPAGVRGVWQRQNLETAEKRLAASTNAQRSREQVAPSVSPQAGVATSEVPSGMHSHDHEIDKQKRASPRTDRLKLRRFANTAAVGIFAIVAAIQLAPEFRWVFAPTSGADWGFSIDAGLHVDGVTPGSSADKAEIKVGDVIDRAIPLRGREILWGPGVAYPGERLTIDVKRGEKNRALTLVATTSHLSTADALSWAALLVAATISVIVGALLALVRPSKMTWGFYLFTMAFIWLPPGGPQYIPPGWMTAYIWIWGCVLVPAGLLGYLIFCLRFPTDSATSWRGTVERWLPLVFIVSVAGDSLQMLTRMFYVAPAALVDIWGTIWDIVLPCIAVLGILSLAGTYRTATELDKQRMKWVFFAVALVLVPFATAALNFQQLFNLSDSFYALGESIGVVLPLAVAYAVLRHRVIDVRFIISRALVLGVIATVIGAVVICLDWLFSTKLYGSRPQTAVYAGAALLVGFWLNASRQRIAMFVDSLFYRQWYRSQQQANAIGDAIHRAASKTDLYEILTAGIANAYSLASVALFEQQPDGGLVRVAAHGWQSGTLWHILPDETVARRANCSRPVDLDSLDWNTQAVPAGVSRPSLTIPITLGKRALAVLFCGAHENGTALDPDEIRMLRRLCVDAGLVYSVPSPDSEKTSLRPRTEVLGTS
ncbi:MAG: helix-turn-helix domain-containing protein [Candidatus Eremiobacteraeota bacterium]|nr:helix-turn-helix domain-containing protein [Candidatus Eremiobacteraeota bacterium]